MTAPNIQFGRFPNKSTNTSSTTTQNLMALLGDLQQCQTSLENDQKALEQNRLEINAANSRMKQLSQKLATVQKQIGDGQKVYADLASELSLVAIKEKVVAESLAKLESDLVAGWERLTFLRSKITSVSSRYLGECSKFAMMYNCTELGAENRSNSVGDELEAMRLAKHQLEYDLQKFLSMLTEVEKSEQENKDLQQQYREQEENDRKKEIEAYNKLNEVEGLLEQLEKRKASLDKSLQEETNKMQAKLDTTKQSISYWERRVSENQRMVGHQQQQQQQVQNPSSTINSSTSPGLPTFPAATLRQGSIQLGNGQTILTNNKIARVSQYVRPTPQVSVSNNKPVTNARPSNTTEVLGNHNPKKTIQTKLQFTSNTKPFNPPALIINKPTTNKPKPFNPPCINITPTTIASKSVLPCPTNENNAAGMDDDPFNDSFISASQYFNMPETTKMMPEVVKKNNQPTASVAVRTFQFKKKPV